MKIKIVIIVLNLVSIFVFSQNWLQVGLGAHKYGVNALYADTTNNFLYASGDFKATSGDTIFGISKWNGIAWDSLGKGIKSSGIIRSISSYKNEIIVGGSYYSDIGGTFSASIAKWNGYVWDSLGAGVSGDVFGMLNYNNELYVCGMFSYAGGIFAKSIAKWDGNLWDSVGTPAMFVATPSSIKIYSNEMYVGGTFDAITDNLIRWDNVNWKGVGSNVITANPGAYLVVEDLAVYKGELYIAGDFYIPGILGKNIVKWDGSSFSTVGGGVDGGITSLIVFNNELFAAGYFNHAGGIPASGIAKWDGAKWCGLGSTFNNGVIHCMEVFQNELYVGGSFNQIDNASINYIAKWIGGNYVDTCGSLTGLDEAVNFNSSINIYPNPTNNSITIEFENTFSKKNVIEITNTLGELVKTINNNSNTKLEIDVSQFATGLYFVTININGKIMTEKFIKQ